MKVDKIVKSTVEEELEITKATLLSIKEAEEYLTNEERKYERWWWLRSPSSYSGYTAGVNSNGNIYNRGSRVTYINDCVRPALQITNLESSNLKIGDTFKISDYEFKIISKELAWMYKQDIGRHAFNTDYKEENKEGNNYETSDVKKYVDKWFRLLMFNESEER